MIAVMSPIDGSNSSAQMTPAIAGDMAYVQMKATW
jgi:hypothetical protein